MVVITGDTIFWILTFALYSSRISFCIFYNILWGDSGGKYSDDFSCLFLLYEGHPKITDQWVITFLYIDVHI